MPSYIVRKVEIEGVSDCFGHGQPELRAGPRWWDACSNHVPSCVLVVFVVGPVGDEILFSYMYA